MARPWATIRSASSFFPASKVETAQRSQHQYACRSAWVHSSYFLFGEQLQRPVVAHAGRPRRAHSRGSGQQGRQGRRRIQSRARAPLPIDNRMPRRVLDEQCVAQPRRTVSRRRLRQLQRSIRQVRRLPCRRLTRIARREHRRFFTRPQFELRDLDHRPAGPLQRRPPGQVFDRQNGDPPRLPAFGRGLRAAPVEPQSAGDQCDASTAPIRRTLENTRLQFHQLVEFPAAFARP